VAFGAPAAKLPRPDAVHGTRQDSDESAVRGQIVYFCDIPLSGLELHMKKYGCFGIAFRKPFLVTRGANPAFYVVKDSILPGDQVLPTGSGSVEASQHVTRAEIMDRIHAEASSLYAKNCEVTLRESCDPGFAITCLESITSPPAVSNGARVRQAIRLIRAGRFSEQFLHEREWRVYGDVLFAVRDVARIILPAAYADHFRGRFPDYGGNLSPRPP